ncbi:hypothetical protein TVAG_126370 [Trichomonas vaginalis G3]|uniref:HECT domain-containing protein n=2 Tax=Trichomonas vaginalis (strain ATCC PRA-98 / G3) TaxID=412133 RepID=A2ED25_TRIV3|nr:hypothetical protein TVAG_126370 [Trichomonas vaginalis G3]|eukprot:XP_001321699.1 hypothetical protein [Trichomonas vaginalis G3]
MGPAPSTVHFSSYTPLGPHNDRIFTTSYDDAPLATEFSSDAILQQRTPINILQDLPIDTIIGCIMTQPSSYTLENNPEDVWFKILIPLFKGSDDKAPIFQQILTEFFKFLNDRSKNTLNDEENRRNILKEVINNKRRNLQHAYSIQLESYDILNENELNNLTNTKNLISNALNTMKLPDFSFRIQQTQTNKLISKRICELLEGNSNSDPSALFESVAWGIFSGDVTPMITTLRLLMKNHYENSKFTSNLLNSFQKFNNNLTLVNAIPVINQSIVDGSKEIPNGLFSNHSTTSSITTDGNYIYLLLKPTTILQISLSKSITNENTRFFNKDINLSKVERLNVGLALSNDKLVVLGEYMSESLLLQTSPLDEEKRIKKSKISLPICSDSKFVYSIRGSNCCIHTFKETKLKLIRKVKLIESGAELKKLFSSKLIPDLSDAILLSNGIILSIIKPIQKNQTNSRFPYIARHFSLITGQHISDIEFALRFPIVSLAIDPWNKCIWGLTLSPTTVGNETERRASLLKLEYNGSYPPWLVGTDISFVATVKESLSIYQAKTPSQLSVAIINFINFYVSHFVGSGFNLKIQDSPDPKCTVPMIFAPGTYYNINEIIKLLVLLKDLYINKKFNNNWTEKQYRFALITLVDLLNFAISNLQINIAPPFEEEPIIDQSLPNLLLNFLEDPHFRFLKDHVLFLICNCFDIIFENNRVNDDCLISHIINDLNPSLFSFFISNLQETTALPYFFSPNSCRRFLSPIMKQLTSLSGNFNRNQYDLVNSFMRSLLFELYKALKTNTGEISEEKQILQDNFYSFSGIITEEMLKLLFTLGHDKVQPEKLQFLPFTRIFQKWLLLLHPFVKFSSVSCDLVSIIQPLYSSLGEKMSSLNLTKSINNTGKGFTFIFSIFYDLFSLYSDFITAMVDGGSEIKDIQKYKWLVKSTLMSGLTSEKVDQIYDVYEKSVNMIDMANNDADCDEIFILNLISKEASDEIKQFMDYIYAKVPDPSNKRLTPERKVIERLIFSSLLKNLGFTSFARELSLHLLTEEKPVLNHAVRQSALQIYRIRRQLEKSRQDWMKLKEECEQSQVPFKLNSLSEDYPNYLKELEKKCLFLLNIRPIKKKIVNENDKIFIQMCKNISDFLTTPVTLSDYFKLLETSQKIQKNITTGIGLINNVFDQNNEICSWYILQKFSTSGSIISFLKSLSKSIRNEIEYSDDETKPKHKKSKSKKHSKKSRSKKQEEEMRTNLIKIENNEVKYILILIGHVQKFLMGNSEHFQQNILLVFLANLLFAMSNFDAEEVFKPLNVLIDQMLNQRKEYNEEEYSSLIAYIISTLYVIINTNDGIITSKQYPKLVETLQKYKEYSQQRKSIAMLFNKLNVFEHQSPMEMINDLASSSPKQFFSTSQFLFQLIDESKNKIGLLYPIFENIAKIASGQISLFCSKYSMPTNLRNTDDKTQFDTAGIQLAGCSIFISMIRRFLINNDEEVLKIINYILLKNKGKQSDTKYARYDDPILLYAVFAILSNVIDVFHFGGIVKYAQENDMYIVTDYDDVNHKIVAWQIPITANSKLTKLDANYNLQNNLLFSFRVSMFPDYSNLLHYFNFAINPNSNTMREGLNYYIISSLKEYATIPNFIQENLPNIFSKFQRNNFNFSFKNQSFLNILRCHLLNKDSEGFRQQRNSKLEFHLVNLTYNYSNIEQVYDSETLQSNFDISYYCTQPLGNKISLFNIKKTDCKNIEFGITSPSYKIWNRKAVYVRKIFKRLDLCGLDTLDKAFLPVIRLFSEIVSFEYNRSTNTIKIVSGTDKYTVNFPSDMTPIFYVIFYDAGKLEYNLDDNLKTDEKVIKKKVNENVFNYKTLTYEKQQTVDKVVVPLRNTMIFKKKKTLPINNVNEIKSSIEVNNDYRPDLEEMWTKVARLGSSHRPFIDEKKQLYFDYTGIELKNTYQSLLTHHSYNSSFNFFQIQKPLLKFSNISYFRGKKDDKIDSIVKMKQIFYPNYVMTNKSDKEIYAVNDMTGKVSKFKDFIELKTLPPMNPDYFISLPTNLINYFDSSVVDDLRLSLFTDCYISQLINGKDFAKTNEIFKVIDDIDVVTMMIHFLTIAEPFNNEEIIDFNVNYFDKNQNVPSNVGNYVIASQTIFNHYQSNNLTHKFIKSVFDLFCTMMKSMNWHYVLDNHSDCYFITNDRSNDFVVDESCEDFICLVTKDNVVVNEETLSHNRYMIVHNQINGYKFHTDDQTLILIPFRDTKVLLGTFGELIVLFKYLVYFLKDNSNIAHELRKSVYSNVLDSYLFNSPFFVTNFEKILSFLQKNIRTTYSDISGDFLSRLNILASMSRSRSIPPYITSFIEEHQAIWDERVLVPLRAYFPEFLTEAEKVEIQRSNIVAKCNLPSDPFAKPITTSQNLSNYKLILNRLLSIRKDIIAYPFHYVITYWSELYMMYPPYTTKIEGYIMKVTFTDFIPEKFTVLRPKTVNLQKINVILPDGTKEVHENTFIYTNNRRTIILEGDVLWGSFIFVIADTQPKTTAEFDEKQREKFVSDMTTLALHWDNQTDQKISNCFTTDILTKMALNFEFDVEDLLKTEMNFDFPLILIRAKLLLLLNWMIFNKVMDLSTDSSSMPYLSYCISSALKMKMLRQIVLKHSESGYISVNVNRASSFDLKNGNSTNYDNSIIAQLSRICNITELRNIKRPWKVTFVGEMAIDAGGPAVELFSNAAEDFTSPNCGLVVKIPNARNEVGFYRDCVVPFPKIGVSYI